MASPPIPPSESPLDPTWPHYHLWLNIRSFLEKQIHQQFHSVVHIAGISVGDYTPLAKH